MIIDIDIEQMPDWARAAKDFGDTATGFVLRAAVLMIIDNTDRMRNRVTLLGHGQRPNSERWAEYKRKVKGHDIPLVFTPILSDPTKWLINGRRAAEMITRTVRNMRSYARRYGQTRKGFRIRSTGLQFVVVKLPPERETIAVDLQSMGFEIPFGMPPEAISILANEVQIELAQFEVFPKSTEVIRPFAFKAILAESR